MEISKGNLHIVQMIHAHKNVQKQFHNGIKSNKQ
jgi:hypothetical protein